MAHRYVSVFLPGKNIIIEFTYSPAGEAEPLSQDQTVTVKRLARDVAGEIPEHTFSIAQIMSYILQNWDSPTSAPRNIGTSGQAGHEGSRG